MKYTQYECMDRCCLIHSHVYDQKNNQSIPKDSKVIKAGMFILDPKQNKVLLVQCRGQKWSIPKGSALPKETIEETAIREVFEETGLVVSKDMLIDTKRVKFYNRTYFFININECKIEVPDIEFNDPSGYTWLKIDCLKKLVEHKHMSINSDCYNLIFERTKKLPDVDVVSGSDSN